MTIDLHTFKEVSSTNDVAREALVAGAPQGSIYRTDRQTAGRGRRGRTWLSEPGNLLMSLILRPTVSADHLPAITLAVAVAARQTLERFGVSCGLKWPNDLLIDGRKLGGILVEGIFEAGRLVGCLVGIGINVALEIGKLDEPLRCTATSFRHLGSPEPDLDALATELGSSIVAQAQLLEAGRLDQVLRAWKDANVTLGNRVDYERKGRLRVGTALDLDDRGALVIDEEGTGRVHVDSGEVRLLSAVAAQPVTESAKRGDGLASHELLLVLDVGNTNTVIGVFDGDRLVEHWRLQTHRERTADEHGMALLQMLSVSRLQAGWIRHMILSSVVPPMTSRLEDMVRRFFDIEPLVVGPGIRTSMPILYENPREVGADRVVNAVAAYEQHRAGLIVVDFGTATTFDAVSPQGEYLGGAIAPGMAISADALFRRAAMLPRVDISRPTNVVGRNTVASMQAGLLYGYVGLVNEIVRRMQRELSFRTRVFATGGLARLVAGETEVIDKVDEHLTLRGLRILFERNSETAR